MPLPRKTNVRRTAISQMSVTGMGSPLAASSPTSSVATKAMIISDLKNRVEEYYKQKLDKLDMMGELTQALFDKHGFNDVVYTHCNDRYDEDQPPPTTFYERLLPALKKNCPGYEHLEISKGMPPPQGTTVVKKRITRSTMKKSQSGDIENKTMRNKRRVTRTTMRRSQSEDIENKNMRENKTGRKKKNSALQTPTSRGRPYQVAAVTPGFRSRTPSVYRKPCAGEQVISMSGSPILVPTENMANQVPQMHIPLADGRVFAVMPQGLEDDMPDFPDIDPETKKQLKMLRQYLEKKILD